MVTVGTGPVLTVVCVDLFRELHAKRTRTLSSQAAELDRASPLRVACGLRSYVSLDDLVTFVICCSLSSRPPGCTAIRDAM